MSARPLHLTFTPANISTTGFATGLTGAGPFTTFTRNAATDSLAHLPTLTSAANLSGINMTVTGTCPDGVAITETIAGPNANTVTLTRHFATITRVTAASTLGANTMDVGWGGAFTSQTIPLEVYLQGNHHSAQLEISGTAAMDIEGTLSDIRQSPQVAQYLYSWVNDANFTNKSATLAAELAVLYRAIRVIVNSYSNGAIVTFDLMTPR